ncbi:bifunctional isocitrate dehydrogenase kinase/phosphatase [Dokdonella sp.]|uniref:bifunctional isocitrate dehydrogenase kinase/phosphatase n=1 Tax=Dokdonella sp. TaxID=2291710 RepID=UPI0031BF46AE|nr:bifunctional isocitrate dehydrogenase kinase/phosphatase [Dokdonella sp.]
MSRAPAASAASLSEAAARSAALILDAFLDYDGRFADITRRAQRHFERRNWRQAQLDTGARIDLYDDCIRETLGRLEGLLDERVRSRPLWAAMREAYAERVAPQPDRELAKTWFNTLSRRYFQTRGVDPLIEFVALGADPLAGQGEPASLRRYALGDGLEAACRQILADLPFTRRLLEPERSAHAMAGELAERGMEDGRALVALEFLDPLFYRERRAYRVGRAVTAGGQASPLVIALVSEEAGLRVDAVLTNLNQVSLLFGYARNAFHADLAGVTAVVAFLARLMPHKPVGEIFTVLGRIKQGKTERYRRSFRHLAEHPEERLVLAPGQRGMVMLVFTPRHDQVVFKLIRDRFAWPKDTSRRAIEAKYRLVLRYDRVGRLVDTQEFRDLRFPLVQVDAQLLAALQADCSATIALEGEQLLIRHCYVQRRLRPLDLYTREMPFDDALRAVLDYGQAIEDLARSGIFPGDLLLKNFGASRIGRAVFYDYDELCLVEDCRFRRIPPARVEDELRPLEEWLSVGVNDVFPELFPRFLGLAPALREALVATHPQIFDPDWWQALRARFLRGEYGDVPPYPASARLPG